jgi:UDP-glucose 4-epimerase
MIALITGGAGFIGSHLADRLIADGHSVWILDDLSTGALVDRADVVFHLAAAVGVKLIVENPTRTIETNVRGSEVVLQAAAKKGRVVVLASSSEVYGKGAKIPYAEDDDLLLGPTTKSRWGYACSKAIDEYLALAYAQERNLPVIVARLFNTVGPRQTGRYGMVLPNFVRQGLSGEDITVYGTGDQTRCFAYVGDVLECLLLLVGREDTRGQVFNVGNDHEISINQLAEIVRQRTGGTSKIVHIPYEQAYAEGFEDLGRRIPDLSKLERTIQSRPRTPIETIVDHVIDDVRERGDS